MHPDTPGHQATAPPEEALKLPELAAASGLPPRTIRYYIQRDLVPAPAFQGRDTLYPRETLLRLKLIQRLQARFMPLDRIRQELSGKSRTELEALLALEEKPVQPEPSIHPGAGAPTDATGTVPVPRVPTAAPADALPRGVTQQGTGETSRGETSRVESSRGETTRVESTRGETSRGETPSEGAASMRAGGPSAPVSSGGGMAFAPGLGAPWRKLELLPGLELWIEEGSSQRMQLARELLSYVRARTQAGV